MSTSEWAGTAAILAALVGGSTVGYLVAPSSDNTVAASESVASEDAPTSTVTSTTPKAAEHLTAVPAPAPVPVGAPNEVPELVLPDAGGSWAEYEYVPDDYAPATSWGSETAPEFEAPAEPEPEAVEEEEAPKLKHFFGNECEKFWGCVPGIGAPLPELPHL